MDEEIDIEKFLIPRRLNDKAQFFLWEMDTAIIFMVTLMMFALLFGGIGFILGAIAAVYMTKQLNRLKELGGKQIVMGVLYWYTPSNLWPAFNKTPASHIREYTA